MRRRHGSALLLTAVVLLSGCGTRAGDTAAPAGDGTPRPESALTCRVTSDGILDYVAGATGAPDPLDAVRDAHVDQATRYEEVPGDGPRRRVFMAYDARDEAIAVVWVVRTDGPGWLLERVHRCG